mmetsp:Transcript_14373/g.19470  ORF Transcript_14373/g.19470 Transcript_14373/m.19470 type:complete len:82 (-) Transcript_14373:1637-1882(-)
MREGDSAFKRNDISSALVLYNKAKGFVKEDAEVLCRITVCHSHLQQFEQMVQEARKATEVDSRRAGAHCLLGRGLVHLGVQ